MARTDQAMVAEAIAMMKNALHLLDSAGAGYTDFACHLCMAIEVGEGRPLAGYDEDCRRYAAALEAAAESTERR